jgi:hypothetical protein
MIHVSILSSLLEMRHRCRLGGFMVALRVERLGTPMRRLWQSKTWHRVCTAVAPRGVS